jgi:hypothetical protein
MAAISATCQLAPPATLSIEKRFLDEIDVNTIINEFAWKNVRRNF